jgi:hypothetical protein
MNDFNLKIIGWILLIIVVVLQTLIIRWFAKQAGNAAKEKEISDFINKIK